MKSRILLFTLIILSHQVYSAEIRDLSIININGIGANKVLKIKESAHVDWWIEMGDKMLIANNHSDLDYLPQSVTLVKTLKNINIENLAYQTLGHCDHSGLDEILHSQLDVVYMNNSSQIIDISNFENKKQVFGHDSIEKFEKNRVLSYQLKNKTDTNSFSADINTQNLVDSVSADRWFSQVEYLSSLDRMEEADLVIAGEWLESKFNDLGLVTSRVSLHNNYRGFNVLGFKQGTTRPDDWYVVGAHMDSRNRFWDDLQPSPGAEDNASGCSGVLEVANVISHYDTEASIVFLCFIEEESGLLGSKDVVTYLTNEGDIDKVKTMLNMDMISYRLGDRNVAIAGTNTSNYQSLAETVAANGNLYSEIDWQINLGMCCTDFLSFSNANIPAVTSNQPDISTYFGYHRTTDLAENLDPVLGSGIVKANLATLIDLVGVDFDSLDLIFSHGFESD